VRKDGTQHPAEIHLSAVTLRGQPIILALAFDITKRKQMEKALQESEATARSLVNAPTDVATLIDTEGIILDANETMADRVNTPVDELIGMCVWDLLPPDVADYRKAHLERVIQSGESIRFEDSRANRWYDSVIYPIRDAQKEITKVAIIARDITERKRAKEALRESEARLALVIKGAGLGMWDWNIQTGDIVLNKRWADMLGYTLDEIEPTIDTWKSLIHPDDLPAVMEALNAHLEGQTPIYQTEHRLRKKSGAWKWVLDTGKVMAYDEQGHPLRATGTHQDITERKQTEQALKRRTESLKAINDLAINLTAAPPSINHFKVIANELKSITNALGISVSAYNPDEQALIVKYIAADGKLVSRFSNLLERKITGIPTPVSDERYAEITDEVMRRAPNLHEISFGTIPKPVSAAAQRMFGIDHCIALALTDGDKLLGSVVIAMPKGQTSPSDEVIETFARVATASLRQRQAEEALRKSKERLQLAMDAGEHGFWDWNLDTDEVYFSPQYCKMLGYGPTELPMVKETWVDLMHPEDRETVVPKIERHIANAEPYAMEFRLKCKDGSWKWISGHGKSYEKDEDGLPHRAVGIHIDITERKQAEKKIKHYANDLERSNRELEQFAYAVSHDLQAPLRTMRGYAHLLKQSYSDQLSTQADKFIDCISENAGRMKAMIEALLDLSRVETGGKTFTAVDCESVLRHVLDALSLTIEGKHAKVTHDPLPTVMADEAQLAQVFQNLIANGIKFRREDASPQVHVSAERGDHAWIFSVEDNGIGIDPEQSKRIFQIFQRLHSEEEYPGLGLGLALCQRIVERHGGRIWVEPKAGPGSTFRFTIPLQRR
jgi:PAS domain S-box-containing protein